MTYSIIQNDTLWPAKQPILKHKMTHITS